jgi:hypothetical protein
VGFWDACARLGRREFLAETPATPAPDGSPAGVVEIGAAEPRGRMLGFHAAETWDGSSFRWSSPLALVEALPPDEASMGRFELLPLRSALDTSVVVVVDGARVPAERCVVEADSLRFPITPGGRRSIALVCNRWDAAANGSGDSRRLGLAVRRLSFAADPL